MLESGRSCHPNITWGLKNSPYMSEAKHPIILSAYNLSLGQQSDERGASCAVAGGHVVQCGSYRHGSEVRRTGLWVTGSRGDGSRVIIM